MFRFLFFLFLSRVHVSTGLSQLPLYNFLSLLRPQWDERPVYPCPENPPKGAIVRLEMYHKELRDTWHFQRSTDVFTTWDDNLRTGRCLHFAMMIMRKAHQLGFCHTRFVVMWEEGNNDGHIYTEVLMPDHYFISKNGRSDVRYPGQVWVALDNNMQVGTVRYENYLTENFPEEERQFKFFHTFDFHTVETYTKVNHEWILYKSCNVDHIMSRMHRDRHRVDLSKLKDEYDEFEVFSAFDKDDFLVLLRFLAKNEATLDHFLDFVPRKEFHDILKLHVCDVVTKFKL